MLTDVPKRLKTKRSEQPTTPSPSSSSTKTSSAALDEAESSDHYDWVPKFLQLRQQLLGNDDEKGSLLKSMDNRWKPRLIAGKTTKRTKTKDGDLYEIEIDSEYSKHVLDASYRFLYPSWILFKSRNDAKQVYKKLTKYLNTNWYTHKIFINKTILIPDNEAGTKKTSRKIFKFCAPNDNTYIQFLFLFFFFATPSRARLCSILFWRMINFWWKIFIDVERQLHFGKKLLYSGGCSMHHSFNKNKFGT